MVLFKTHENFNPDKLCVATSYIQDDIMIEFIMAFKCVLKILKTCVNFAGLREANYFCSRKMFTCRKLTGVQTLLPVSITFLLNENTNTCTSKSEHSDYISHPNTHTQTLKEPFYIYMFGFNFFNSLGIFRLRYVKLQLTCSQWVVALWLPNCTVCYFGRR